ncbi:MAG: hypothetical protein O7E49_04380, partial [Gemmatimonadetes bacterium]|nr:hypothetical protein [Gemmatimonadota bacterium]
DLPPGEYRVTTKMGNLIESVLWPDIVRVEPGESVNLGLQSTIRAEFPDGVAPYSWAIVSADDPVEVLQSADGSQRALLVPPGEYRVTTKMGNLIESVLWPDIVRVEPSDSVNLGLQSTIRAEFPDGVAPYRWAIVSADDPIKVLMTVRGTQRALLVPPGEYRVTTKMGNLIESVLWPDIVRVAAGRVTVVRPAISPP